MVSSLTCSSHFTSFAHFKTIGAVGASIPVLAHKALPGITDYKADLAAAYSSKNGMVLAENLAGDEASTWEKIKGAKDLTGFGAEFINALSKHRHWHRKQTEEVAF